MKEALSASDVIRYFEEMNFFHDHHRHLRKHLFSRVHTFLIMKMQIERIFDTLTILFKFFARGKSRTPKGRKIFFVNYYCTSYFLLVSARSSTRSFRTSNFRVKRVSI